MSTTAGAPAGGAVRSREARWRRWLGALAPRLDGARGVWLVAGAVGLVFAGLIAWNLVRPRDYLTGTNSVAARIAVATLQRGDRLCVPALHIPGGTARIQVPAFSKSARVDAVADVRVGARSASAPIAVPVVRHTATLEVPIPRVPSSVSSVPGQICLTGHGPGFDVFGTANILGGQVPARLNGRPLRGRVAVRYLPAPGARRSLASSAGDIFRRAALFRPGVVGPWTYPALLGLMLAVWLGAVALLARSAAGRRTRVPAALTIAVIAFLNAGSWALITPAFNAPDEPEHFAYAQYLAETGKAPAQAPGPRGAYSTAETLALNGVRLYLQVQALDGRPPWLKLDERRWERVVARVHPRRDNGGGVTSSASPHRPGYYALLVPVYLATSHQSVFSQLTAMRLVSALLGAIAAACAFALVRELLPRQGAAAVGAGLLVAAEPMFSFMAGAVNNDMGVNAAAALLLFLVVRGLRRGLTWRTGLAIGVVLALTPIMKGTGWALYPAAGVGIAGMLWRRHGRADLPAYALLAVTFGAVWGAWDLVQPGLHQDVFAHLGRGRGAGAAISATGAVSGAFHQPVHYFEYLWQVFLPRVPGMTDYHPQAWPAFDIYVRRGWASFGWYTFEFPRWVYQVVVVAMLGVGALAAATALRNRPALRRRAFEVLVIVVATVGVIVAVEATFFPAPVGGRQVVAEQGRYAFTAIAAFAAIAVAGTFGLGRRWHVPLLTVLVVATIGMCFASQLLTLASFYT